MAVTIEAGQSDTLVSPAGVASAAASLLDAVLDEQQKTGWIAPHSSVPSSQTLIRGIGGIGVMSAKPFQYWPDEIQDSKDIGWQTRDIPGQSIPLYYWVQGGARTISFTAQFSRDVGGVDLLDFFQLNLPEAVLYDGQRNPDLRAIAKWLRWFCYPWYPRTGQSTSDILVYPPPTLLLGFPGLQLALDGSDDLVCVMTSCGITYTDFFPDGTPKRMNASLEFAEIPQDGQQVTWRGREDNYSGSAGYAGEGYGPIDYNISVVK